MAIQQPGFRPAVDRPRDQSPSSPTSANVPSAQGTAVAPHLKQLDQNRDQGQQGGQGQDKGSGGQGKDGTVVVNLGGAREAAATRTKQATAQATQAQTQGRAVQNQAAVLARGINLFYVTKDHTKRFEKHYKPGGKNSSLSGKAIVVTGETPEDWEDQIEGNMREARHQTRSLSSYHVAMGYYDEG